MVRRGVGGGKVREYEGWEGEREEVGAEWDGRRGGGKGDGEEVLYAITCTYTLLFQSNTCTPKPMTTYLLCRPTSRNNSFLTPHSISTIIYAVH